MQNLRIYGFTARLSKVAESRIYEFTVLPPRPGHVRPKNLRIYGFTAAPRHRVPLKQKTRPSTPQHWCSHLDFFDCPFYSSSSIALFLLAYFMFLFSPNVAFFLPVPVLTGLAMQAALLRGPRIQSEGRNQLSH